MKTIHLRKQSGSSLVVVISVLATLMVVVGVAAEYTWTVNRHVQRSNTLERAVAVGDSSLEMLFANWRAISSSAPTTLQPTSAFASIATPTSSQFPDIPGFAATATDYYGPNTPNPPTVSNYKVVAANAEWQALAGPGATPIPMLGQIAQAISSGSNTLTTPLVYNYVASADVTLPALGPTGTVVAKVRRVFQKQQLSPWNFAIFYVDPLEINPGPQFTVTGWVNTNSDLYTGHNTLTFADKVTYGSDWFVGFKPGDGTHPETPSAPLYPSNLPPARSQAMQPFGMDSTSIFNTADTNPNNDGYRELIQRPIAGYPDPLWSSQDQSRYWDQASVIIRINADDSYTIGTPHSVAGVSDGTINVLNSGALYNMFNSAITTLNPDRTRQSIQDDRENTNIQIATLDISKIEIPPSGPNPTPSYKATAVQGFNGIIYIYDVSATSHPLNPDGTVNLNVNVKDDRTTNATPVKRGIRIKNGSKIPSNIVGQPSGLTIASANPVYIQGDFNTGSTPSSTAGATPNPQPPSNYTSNNDPLTPQVSGYTRASCSILADAVNILSNSWVDGATGAPTAANTTINAAIVSGIVPTAPAGGDGSYSGGAENFPRFLEDWTGKALTYYGSMVELYKSQQSTGEWTCCSVYSPPNRQWYFDTNFKIKPPPGTIMIYSYIKGKWSVL